MLLICFEWKIFIIYKVLFGVVHSARLLNFSAQLIFEQIIRLITESDEGKKNPHVGSFIA